MAVLNDSKTHSLNLLFLFPCDWKYPNVFMLRGCSSLFMSRTFCFAAVSSFPVIIMRQVLFIFHFCSRPIQPPSDGGIPFQLGTIEDPHTRNERIIIAMTSSGVRFSLHTFGTMAFRCGANLHFSSHSILILVHGSLQWYRQKRLHPRPELLLAPLF